MKQTMGKFTLGITAAAIIAASVCRYTGEVTKRDAVNYMVTGKNPITRYLENFSLPDIEPTDIYWTKENATPLIKLMIDGLTNKGKIIRLVVNGKDKQANQIIIDCIIDPDKTIRNNACFFGAINSTNSNYLYSLVDIYSSFKDIESIDNTTLVSYDYLGTSNGLNETISDYFDESTFNKKVKMNYFMVHAIHLTSINLKNFDVLAPTFYSNYISVSFEDGELSAPIRRIDLEDSIPIRHKFIPQDLLDKFMNDFKNIEF